MKEKSGQVHSLLTEESVAAFVRERTDYFEEKAELTVEEIGDGNINYVFRVKDRESGKSLIVKQADKLLRSSKRPLALYRSRIEAFILKLYGESVPDFVPRVFCYDEAMAALIMEDISTYQNLRTALREGKRFPDFSKQISSFLVRALFPTTDFVMDRMEKKRRVASFINPELCDITEDLVLTEPYFDYKGRNIITEGMEDFVRERLYQDTSLHEAVAELRFLFMNKAEALLHGDLHTGSIFVNNEGMKVIDPEFAFYGPMAYDIGNVIGNLSFPLVRDIFKKDRKDFTIWLKRTMAEIFDKVREGLIQSFDMVSIPLYNSLFREAYVNQVMKESLGFAGTEMIRRVVGDAKVAEMSEFVSLSEKIRAEKILIEFGIFLIKGNFEKIDGNQVIRELERVVGLYEADGQTG